MGSRYAPRRRSSSRVSLRLPLSSSLAGRTFRSLSLTLAFVVAACTPGPGTEPAAQTTEADISLSGPVAVTLWHNQTGDLAKAFTDMVTEFNSTNGKGITVRAEFQGNYTQIYQKTLGAIQAGSLPEAIVAVESQVADYAKAGVVVDIDPYIKSKKNGLTQQSLDDVYKTYFETNRYMQYEGRLLSFPFIKSLEVLIVNDDILKEVGATAPKTWEDFERIAKTAKKTGADGKVTRWGWMYRGDASGFDAWVLSRGGKLISDDGTKVGWDGKEGLEALKLLDRCIKEQWCYRPTGFDWQDRFGEGNLLFAQGTSTGRPFIKAAFKKPITWSIFGMPATAGQQVSTVLFGGVMTITKSTPEKQLAVWEFLKWFTDSKQTAKWAQISSYMPIRKTAAEDSALKAHYAGPDVQGKQAFDLVPTSASAPNIRGTQDIRNVVFDMLERVVQAKATPEEALAAAALRANQILKDNR